MLLEESLALSRIFDTRAVDAALHLLSRVAMARGEPARARGLLTDSLQRRKGGAPAAILETLEGFAALAAAEVEAGTCRLDDARRAVQLLGAVAAQRAALAPPLPPGERATYERHAAALHNRLGVAVWQACWAVGQVMTLDEAVALGLIQEAGSES